VPKNSNDVELGEIRNGSEENASRRELPQSDSINPDRA